VDALVDLGDYLMDTAPERLEVLKKTTEQLIDDTDLRTLRDIARPGPIDDPNGLFEFLRRFGVFTASLGADIYDAVVSSRLAPGGGGVFEENDPEFSRRNRRPAP